MRVFAQSKNQYKGLRLMMKLMFRLYELLHDKKVRKALKNAKFIDVQCRSFEEFPIEFFQSNAVKIRAILPNISSPKLEMLKHEDDYNTSVILHSYSQLPYENVMLEVDGDVNYFYLSIQTNKTSHVYVGSYLRTFHDLQIPVVKISEYSVQSVYYGDFCTRHAMGIPLTSALVNTLLSAKSAKTNK